MGTRITLDANYPVLVRRGLLRHRQVGQFCGALKSQAYLWPGSKILTLMPVNLLSTFVSTPAYEIARYRLDELIHDPAWWDEKPMNVEPDPDSGERVSLNYFYNSIVASENISTEGNVLDKLSDVQAIDNSLGPGITESTISKNAFVSKKEIRENQGLQVRWRRDSFEAGVGTLWVLYFGQFAYRVVDSGVCFLYEKNAAQTYIKVAEWRWLSKPDEGGDGEYQITIYPHGNNKIEFVTKVSGLTDSYSPGNGGDAPSFYDYGTVDQNVYVYQTTKQTYFPDGASDFKRVITQKGRWKLAVTPKIRHLIQVSNLLFKNDTGGYWLNDVPMPFGFYTLVAPMFSPTYYKNGGSINARFMDPIKDLEVGAHTVSNSGQFGFQMRGKGDVQPPQPHQPPLSSDSPEMFGYTVRIAPTVKMDDRTPVHANVLSVRAKLVAAPHEHEYTIVVLNEHPRKKAINVLDWLPTDVAGPLDAFKMRPYIPIRVWDDETGEVLLEGVCHTVRGTEAPSSEAMVLELSCRSMADRLMRHYAIDLDFTSNIAIETDQFGDNIGQWTWASALGECFAHAGFNDLAVSIEDVEQYDFALWPEGDSNSKSQGNTPSAPTQRWRPNPNAPIYKWMDFLIRDIIGWHWDWVRSTLVPPANPGEKYSGAVLVEGYWSIFKRPRPKEIKDPTIKPPKVAFFSGWRSYWRWKLSPNYDKNLPYQFHRNMHFEAVAPSCTSIRCVTFMTGIKGPDGTAPDGTEAPSKTDPDVYRTDGLVTHDWENPDGYDIPDCNRKANRTIPHYIGSQIMRTVNLVQAATLDAFEWIGARFYEDLTFGRFDRMFTSEWIGPISKLRHWDCVLIDPPSVYDEVNDPDHLEGKYLVDSIEPAWERDEYRKASFKCWKVFKGSAPPR